MKDNMLHYRIFGNITLVFTTIFFASQVYSQTCGRSKSPTYLPTEKAAGVFNATEGAWPWMAAIQSTDRSGTYRHWCSGFLIDRKHVISAAHCYDGPEHILYSARIGSVNEDKGDAYDVTKIAVPPLYRKGLYYHDIAILTLSREVDVPDFVPICLPDESISKRDFADMQLTVVGWSNNIPTTKWGPYLIEMSKVPVVSNEACSRIYREAVKTFKRQFRQGLTTDILCAGFPDGTDGCVNSGGPLMFQDRNRWFAVGSVSFGYGCGRPGFPDGFTKISSHLEWIKENTKN